MTKTYHTLFNAAGTSEEATKEYDAARAALVKEIAGYLDGRLAEGLNAHEFACSALTEAEDSEGGIHERGVNIYIPGRYTADGRAIDASFK